MNIAIVGTGYVGLVTGACFAEFGLKVTGIDKDKEKIDLLNQGKSPIYEPGLEEKIKKYMAEGLLTFTSDIAEGVKKALVIFIAVGTPQKKDGSADLSYIDEVARSIAENMNGYKVIVTKSTVPVGTGERIKKIIRQHQKVKIDFDVVSNPEFLREGSAIEDFMRPNRVIIGAESSEAVAIMKDLYSPLFLIETPFIITNIETAEMIKYASNAFLATKVSFINEMANLCELVGADVHIVAKGMGLDNRIGPKFLHPGPGFGGSCFPKDTRAIVQIADKKGYDLSIVKSAIEVNERQRELMMEKIIRVMGDLNGKKIALLGLSFKPNTDDIRESPAIYIVGKIKEKGAKIRTYDPAAMENIKEIYPDIEYAGDPYDAASGCDAVVIITEWNQFRNLDLERLKSLMKKPVMIDLRNIYEPERMRRLGFIYDCVGRVKRNKSA